MDDLRSLFDELAADAPLVGDIDRAIAEETRQARRRRIAVGAVVAATGAAAAVAAIAVLTAHAEKPPRPTPSAPLPLVERHEVAPRANGDLALVVDRGLVRRTPAGNVVPWVERHVLRDACDWHDCDVYDLAWSPDGSALAFVMGVQGRTTPSHFAVYVVGYGASTPRKVFDCPDSMCSAVRPSMSWAPDSRALAVSATAAGLDAGIAVVDLDGVSPTARTVCADCGAELAEWSPDGRWLAFATLEGIRRISIHGGPGDDVYPFTSMVESLAWSPAGTELLVETQNHVRVLDLSRRPYTEHTVADLTSSEGPSAPAWSPDGHRVSWFSTPGLDRNFHAEVWTAAADGTRRARLLHSACCVSDWTAPFWSPDGRYVALGLSLDPSSPPDLLVLDATDGTEVARVPDQGWDPVAWQGLP